MLQLPTTCRLHSTFCKYKPQTNSFLDELVGHNAFGDCISHIYMLFITAAKSQLWYSNKITFWLKAPDKVWSGHSITALGMWKNHCPISCLDRGWHFLSRTENYLTQPLELQTPNLPSLLSWYTIPQKVSCGSPKEMLVPLRGRNLGHIFTSHPVRHREKWPHVLTHLPACTQLLFSTLI